MSLLQIILKTFLLSLTSLQLLYNNIGGIKVADAAIYTVVTVGSVGKLRDGAAGDTYLEYNNANKPKVDARQHGDALSNYSTTINLQISQQLFKRFWLGISYESFQR